jgi:alpha-1,3-glucan synthase
MMTRLSLFSSHGFLFTLAILSGLTTLIHALKYDADQVNYNLNTNKTATNPLDYWGRRPTTHEYAISPTNWRFPFYTVFLDRYVNGDPENDNANSTLFETDRMATQLRYGGDLEGLIDSLDYIAGMGIKVRGRPRDRRAPSDALGIILTTS